MRISILFIASLFSWAAYDTNLFRRRNDHFVIAATEISLSEIAIENQQQQKILRRRMDVIPPWERGNRLPLASMCNYFSTKPRDVRFSNQRKIRRMFNNM